MGLVLRAHRHLTRGPTKVSWITLAYKYPASPASPEASHCQTFGQSLLPEGSSKQLDLDFAGRKGLLP